MIDPRARPRLNARRGWMRRGRPGVDVDMRVFHQVPEPERPWLFWLFAAAAVLILAGDAWLNDTADPEKVWRDADANLLAGKYEAAGAGVARLGRLRAPTPRDRVLSARVALARGRVDDALSDLARVPDQDPDAARARLLAGQAELGRHRLRAAEPLLKEAARLDPTLVEAHQGLASVYGRWKAGKERRETFRALAGLTPLTFDDLIRWSSPPDPKGAVEALGAAVKADPEDRRSRAALAEALRAPGRIDEAIDMIAQLPADDPDAREVRARVALDRKDGPAADALLKDPPAGHAGLNRLAGRRALEGKDAASALKFFRAALAVEPDDRESLDGAGQALTALGRKDEAAPLLARAKDVDALESLLRGASASKDDPKSIRSLAAACERVGRLPEARAWYSLLIRQNPLDSEAQKALFRLDRTPSE